MIHWTPRIWFILAQWYIYILKSTLLIFMVMIYIWFAYFFFVLFLNKDKIFKCAMTHGLPWYHYFTFINIICIHYWYFQYWKSRKCGGWYKYGKLDEIKSSVMQTYKWKQIWAELLILSFRTSIRSLKGLDSGYTQLNMFKKEHSSYYLLIVNYRLLIPLLKDENAKEQKLKMLFCW